MENDYRADAEALWAARGYVLGRLAALASRAADLRALGITYDPGADERRDVRTLREIAEVLGLDDAGSGFDVDGEEVRHAAE